METGLIVRTWLRLVGRGVILCLSLVLVAQADPSGQPRVLTAEYCFERPQLTTTGGYTRITLPDCGHLHRLGEPAMPFRTARLQLPAGCTVTQVIAIAMSEPTAVEGQWRIEAAGQPHVRPDRQRVHLAPDNNLRIYASDAPYPASAAELISIQRLAGTDIALVRVFPVQYKPASKQLLFTPQITLRLDLGPAPAEKEPRVHPPSQAQAASRVAAFVDNPDNITGLPLGGSLAKTACDYLLITSSSLAAAFQPLVERKQQDGLAVKVATLETITNAVPGRDVQEKIRNYIRRAYTECGISYVLLGGGTTVIPCRTAYVRTDLASRDSSLPTDLYYACLDGSWNGNDDQHWGESTDGENGGDVDLLAEVYVGRAPVATPEQVKSFVEKTVRYEMEGNANRTHALLMATFLGDFPTGPCQGGDMYNPLQSLLHGFHVDALDDAPQKLPQWTRNEALAALNRSPHVVLYNGHGSADTLMRMRTPDLKALANPRPFLMCSVGCSAAEFDHGKHWPDSIGETLINGNRFGAFAAVLNARAGWFDPQYPWKYSGEFQTGFFKELLHHGHVNLGMANQLGKEALIGQVETKSPMTYRWCYYGITLLGDPHVPFQAAGP